MRFYYELKKIQKFTLYEGFPLSTSWKRADFARWVRRKSPSKLHPSIWRIGALVVRREIRSPQRLRTESFIKTRIFIQSELKMQHKILQESFLAKLSFSDNKVSRRRKIEQINIFLLKEYSQSVFLLSKFSKKIPHPAGRQHYCTSRSEFRFSFC